MNNSVSVNRNKIDILRAIAIIAVILIHTIGYVFRFYHPLTQSWLALLSFDQIIRFSVPLFVAISGLTLAYKYRETVSVPLKDFYLRRIFKILPLYLIFSIGIYYFIQFFDPQPSSSEKFSLWQALLFGKADYHLYFVPMLFQLYLLFPLLFSLISKMNLKILIPIFIIQAIIYFITGSHVEKTNSDFAWTDQHTYVYFWNWIFYFCLGIYLSRQAKPKSYLKYVFILGSLFGLDWLVENSLILFKAGTDIINFTRFTQIPTLFYATGVILLLVFWGNRLNSLPEKLKNGFVIMGRDSFVVYLIHTVVLRLIFTVWKIPGSTNVYLLSLMVIILSFLTARIFNLFLSKITVFGHK